MKTFKELFKDIKDFQLEFINKVNDFIGMVNEFEKTDQFKLLKEDGKNENLKKETIVVFSKIPNLVNELTDFKNYFLDFEDLLFTKVLNSEPLNTPSIVDLESGLIYWHERFFQNIGEKLNQLDENIDAFKNEYKLFKGK